MFMMPGGDVRLLLTDDIWIRLAAAIALVRSNAGRPPSITDRMFMEAVLHFCRTGHPWRDLPPVFGNWNTIYQRFSYWCDCGLWEALWTHLAIEENQDVALVFLDSTYVRAHPCAAGAPSSRGGQEEQALGKSPGGFTTKIHVLSVDENNVVAVVVTAGNEADVNHAEAVLDRLPPDVRPREMVADKAYDSDPLRGRLRARGVEPIIPGKSNRIVPIPIDKAKYRRRNVVERFFSKVKQFRRIATRYEKLSSTFIGMFHLASIFVMLR